MRIILLLSQKYNMRIVLLSDIHMSYDGKPIWQTDVLFHLKLCMSTIKKLKDIDIIIIAGDISNDGNVFSYKIIDKIFQEIDVPVYCCPGNHDCIQNLKQTLSFVKYERRLFLKGWQFIFLNSVVPDDVDLNSNKARGYLNDLDLKSVEDSLLLDSYNTIIVLHHPVIEPEGWLNRKLLDNKRQFVDLVSKYNHVKMVLMGHIHSYYQKKINNTIYVTAPSIGYAFNAELPKFQIDAGEEGFLLIDTDLQSIEKIKLKDM